MKGRGVTLVLVAVFGAAVAALTLVFRVPVTATGGYLNLGDVLIIFCGLFFGRLVGGGVGALGSAAADIIGGYAVFAPLTFLVKGLEGLIPGLVTGKSASRVRAALGAFAGASFMVLGYFIGESLMPSIGPENAALEVPGNAFQGLAGAIGGYGLFFAVDAAFGGSATNAKGQENETAD